MKDGSFVAYWDVTEEPSYYRFYQIFDTKNYHQQNTFNRYSMTENTPFVVCIACRDLGLSSLLSYINVDF